MPERHGSIELGTAVEAMLEISYWELESRTTTTAMSALTTLSTD